MYLLVRLTLLDGESFPLNPIALGIVKLNGVLAIQCIIGLNNNIMVCYTLKIFIYMKILEWRISLISV